MTPEEWTRSMGASDAVQDRVRLARRGPVGPSTGDALALAVVRATEDVERYADRVRPRVQADMVRRQALALLSALVDDVP